MYKDAIFVKPDPVIKLIDRLARICQERNWKPEGLWAKGIEAISRKSGCFIYLRNLQLEDWQKQIVGELDINFKISLLIEKGKQL